MKLLAVTNLFGYPWDASRGTFNQQQFDRLAAHVDLSVLVAVPWREALRRPLRYWNARREGRKLWPYVDYFVFWYVPGVGQALHSLFFFLSLALQRPFKVFAARHDALLGSWGFPDAVAVSMIGAITRTPTLTKVHGTDINEYLGVPGKRWQILAAARRSSAVMCPSQALKIKLVDAGIDADKVSVIYNGVDSAAFKPRQRASARRTLGIDPAERLVLFVGNLKTAKGCVDLLEAFASVAASDAAARLVYIGGGDAFKRLRQQAFDVGIADRVRFVGKAPHASLPDWFAAADVLCLPSHNEGVPNVVLEAMACGTPVVATRVGGIPEILPDFAGRLVEAHDIDGLATALRATLDTEWPTERIAEHARGFDWDTNVRSVLALCDRAASGNLQPSAIA